MNKTFLFVLITSCFISAHGQSVISGEIGTRLDNFLSEYESKGFSGIIWAEKDGEVLLKKAYGIADREAEKPMTLETGFDLGSIVKWFTRMAIHKLDVEDKLSISDPISKYFPNIPEDKADITIDQVLRHRAGFVNYLGGDYEVISKEEAIKRLFDADLVLKPGTKFRYSNGGYSLLAILIEKVTGEPYEDYVVREILRPMGMNNTGYLQGGWEPGNLVVGYRRNGDRWGHSLEKEWAEDGPSWTLRGNGGMLTNISDLRSMISYFEREDGDELQQKFRAILIRGGIIGTAGGNDVFNVDIEWDIRKRSGVIIMSSIQHFKGEMLILETREGSQILKEIME